MMDISGIEDSDDTFGDSVYVINISVESGTEPEELRVFDVSGPITDEDIKRAYLKAVHSFYTTLQKELPSCHIDINT